MGLGRWNAAGYYLTGVAELTCNLVNAACRVAAIDPLDTAIPKKRISIFTTGIGRMLKDYYQQSKEQ